MTGGIPDDWRRSLADAIEHPSFNDLTDFVAHERARTDTTVYPPEAAVFEALRRTPLRTVRAVILGQDPYFTEGLATGLAFSIPEGLQASNVTPEHLQGARV